MRYRDKFVSFTKPVIKRWRSKRELDPRKAGREVFMAAIFRLDLTDSISKGNAFAADNL